MTHTIPAEFGPPIEPEVQMLVDVIYDSMAAHQWELGSGGMKIENSETICLTCSCGEIVPIKKVSRGYASAKEGRSAHLRHQSNKLEEALHRHFDLQPKPKENLPCDTADPITQGSKTLRG